MENLLVLGIGNILMGDEGAGVHTVNRLKSIIDECEHLRIVDGGTLGLDLLNYIEWADILIVIDAVNVGLPSGTIIKADYGNSTEDFITLKTAHHIGVSELLASAGLLDILPVKIIIYGIQVEKIDMTLELTDNVSANIGELCKNIKKEIETIFY